MLKLSTIAWALALMAEYIHGELDAAQQQGAKQQARRAKMREAEKRARKLAKRVLAAFREGTLESWGAEGAQRVYDRVRYGDLVEAGATPEEEEAIQAWADAIVNGEKPEPASGEAIVVEPIPAAPAEDPRLRDYARQMASGSPIVRSSLTAHNADWLKDQNPKVVRDALAHAFGQPSWSLASYYVHGLLLGVTGLDIDPKPPTTQHRGFDVARAFAPKLVGGAPEVSPREAEAKALACKVAKAWATTPAETRTDALGALTPDALTWLQTYGVPAAFEGVEPDFNVWPKVTPEGRTVDRHQLASSFSLACNVLLGVGMPQIKPPIDAYPPPWKGVMDAVGDTSDPYVKLPVLPTLARPAPLPEPEPEPVSADSNDFI